MASFFIKLQRLVYRNRSITFTSAGTRFVLLALAVGVAAINTGNNLLYLILGMLLSLIIVSGILSEQTLRNLTLDWNFPARIFAQQPITVGMRVSNLKRWLPSFSFRVEHGDRSGPGLYIFKLSARRTITSGRILRFEARGLRPLPPVTFRTAFPFGFFQKSLVRPQSRTVLVFPRILPPPPGFGTTRAQTGRTPEHRLRGSGAALRGLRDYTPVDDARGIHWKASARESKLLLKEYEREESGRVRLCFSNSIPGKQWEDFERAVVLTASLAYAFSRRGDAVSLATLSSAHTTPDDSRDLDDVLKTLALIEPFAPTAAEPLDPAIAALARTPAADGRRILILPSSDPAWEGFRGNFSEVLIADESRWKEWEDRSS